MPYKDGTGPDGKGPKKTDKGTPTPKRDGSGDSKRRGNQSPGLPGGRGRRNK